MKGDITIAMNTFFGKGINCVQCMPGGSCPGPKVNPTQSKAVKPEREKLQPLISKMILRRGYFPFPSESDVKSIHECPSSQSFGKICAPTGNCGCYVHLGNLRYIRPWYLQ